MTQECRIPDLLQVDGLHVWFPVKKPWSLWKTETAQYIRAVDGVSLHMAHGEVLGIVGESGCGKSTLARAVVRLERAASGHVYIEGEDIAAMKATALKRLRPKVQMIFQDPYASLNPRMTVFDVIAEPIHVHRRRRRRWPVKSLSNGQGRPGGALCANIRMNSPADNAAHCHRARFGAPTTCCR